MNGVVGLVVMRWLVFFGVFFACQAWAIPEAARYGHFTCTSCHISPGGAGALTPYGREFSAQKLSTWRYSGEENPLHGLLPISDHFFLGGDVRWVYMNRSTEDESKSEFWRMQSDVEAAAHAHPRWFEPVWVSATFGTTPAGPHTSKKEANKIRLRAWMARIDTWHDHIVARIGLFMPKFGLMLSDHTAYVRIAAGLNPDGEQTQAEVIYQNDRFEVTAALLVKSESNDRVGKSKSGFNAGLSGYFLKSRFNLNILSTELEQDQLSMKVLDLSASTVVTATSWLYGMFEADHIKTTTSVSSKSETKESVATFASANFDIMRGIIPYLRYEFWDTDLKEINTSKARWGAGANWYPRPHLHVDLRFLRTIDNISQIPANQIDAILHYYF